MKFLLVMFISLTLFCCTNSVEEYRVEKKRAIQKVAETVANERFSEYRTRKVVCLIDGSYEEYSPCLVFVSDIDTIIPLWCSRSKCSPTGIVFTPDTHTH